MDCSVTTDIGVRKARREGINEDSVAATVFEDIHRDTVRTVGVFVLADGAGGHDAGDVASYVATSVVSKHLLGGVLGTVLEETEPFGVDLHDPMFEMDATEREDLEGAIAAAIEAAHARILEYARAAKTEAYTTIVAGVLIDGTLHYGWVGDSRLYLVNSERESIEPLTVDHSRVTELLAAGELTAPEARVHPDGPLLNRALGGSQYEHPETSQLSVDTGSVPVYRDDRVLATSDGLIDAASTGERVQSLYRAYQQTDDTDAVVAEIEEALVTDADIRDVVLAAESTEAAAEDLADYANEQGGKDNLSVAVFEDPSSPPTPDGPLDRAEYPKSPSEMTTVVRPSGGAAPETDDSEPTSWRTPVRLAGQRALAAARDVLPGRYSKWF